MHGQKELTEKSRKLEQIESSRKVDQVLQMMRTKRYHQPKYAVTYLQVFVFHRPGCGVKAVFARRIGWFWLKDRLLLPGL